MKLITFIVSCVVLPVLASAKPLRPVQIEADLGDALGFQIYRYEAQLRRGDVLVVHEIVEKADGSRWEVEHARTGDAQCVYRIVLMDCCASNPSVRNTYLLKLDGGPQTIEQLSLTQTTFNGNDGIVEFKFSAPESNQVMLTRRWQATIEAYTDVVKRWPNLPKPRAGGWSGSSRVVSKTPPK